MHIGMYCCSTIIAPYFIQEFMRTVHSKQSLNSSEVMPRPSVNESVIIVSNDSDVESSENDAISVKDDDETSDIEFVSFDVSPSNRLSTRKRKIKRRRQKSNKRLSVSFHKKRKGECTISEIIDITDVNNSVVDLTNETIINEELVADNLTESSLICITPENEIKITTNSVVGTLSKIREPSEINQQPKYNSTTITTIESVNLVPNYCSPYVTDTNLYSHHPTEIFYNNARKPLENSNNIYTSKIGYNVYNPCGVTVTTGLRRIFIDGSNVAMKHTNGKYFSVKGLEICIDYFEKRGHFVIAFVPQYRLQHNESSDSKRLQYLEKMGKVICTPSRRVQGKRITSYDDRYVVQSAAEYGGIIVSCDNFRDLWEENPAWREAIDKRLLMFTWVGDCLIFPQDPLGQHGVKLDVFLTFDSDK